MKIKLIAIGIISILIVIAIPVASAPQVNADNTTEELTLEQKIIERQKELEERKKQELAQIPPPQPHTVITNRLQEILSGMSPTDNISVLIYLKGDPTLDQKIRDIWEGQPDDEMHTISESLMQKLRKISAETRSYWEQLRAGDPDALVQYKEVEEKYGVTKESTQTVVQRLNELHDAKIRQIAALEEQAYAALHKLVTQKIEQLPDTKVTSSNFMLNSLGVETKAGNIPTIAAMSEVIEIGYNSIGIMCISSYLGLALLSPNNGSTGNNTKQISFSWKPLEETTKYEITLAKDPGLTQIIKQDQTINITYEYDGTLDYNTNYFWQVKGIEPPSDPSATFSFRTEALPAPSPPAEVPPQSTPWLPFLITGLVIAFAAAIGILIWFLIVRSRRGKMKTSE